MAGCFHCVGVLGRLIDFISRKFRFYFPHPQETTTRINIGENKKTHCHNKESLLNLFFSTHFGTGGLFTSRLFNNTTIAGGSSLMKYIELPVSPFTGQPNVNLPIYTIRQGSIEVPVSVSYHGGGIKVFEQGFMEKKKSRQNSNMQLYPSHICLRCSC